VLILRVKTNFRKEVFKQRASEAIQKTACDLKLKIQFCTFSGGNWAFWSTAHTEVDSNGATEFITTSRATLTFSNIPSCLEGWDIHAICKSPPDYP